MLSALIAGKLEQKLSVTIPKLYIIHVAELELHLNVKVRNFWQKIVSPRSNALHSILINQTSWILESVKIPKLTMPWS